MKINIAYISQKNADEAREAAARLAKAVKKGKVSAADVEEQHLRGLAGESELITEEQWRNFLKEIRKVQADFSADYLLDSNTQEFILAIAWDPAYNNIIRIVRMALDNGGLVLELPLEGEDDDQR
jgi:hypothetical protein